MSKKQIKRIEIKENGTEKEKITLFYTDNTEEILVITRKATKYANGKKIISYILK